MVQEFKPDQLQHNPNLVGKIVVGIGQRAVIVSNHVLLTVNIGHGLDAVPHVDLEYETEKLSQLPNLGERSVTRMRELHVTSKNALLTVNWGHGVNVV